MKATRTTNYKFDSKDKAKATCMIKVGELEKEVTFKIISIVIEEGDVVGNVSHNMYENFTELYKAGVKIDVEDIKAEFKKASENYEEYILKQKELKLSKQYAELWYKKESGYTEVNKVFAEGYLYFEYKGVELKIPNFEEWKKIVDFDKTILTIIYKNIKVKVVYVNVARSNAWSRSRNVNMKFQVEKYQNSEITETTRSYSKFDTMVEKIKELVDNYLKINAQRLKNKQVEEKRVQDTINCLKEQFENESWKVKFVETEKYSNYSRQYYKINSYYLEKGDITLTISIQDDKDGYTTYNLNGIKHLNYIQVLAMLDIL